MAHGLDDVETGQTAALPRRAADRILAFVNDLVVKASSAALVGAVFLSSAAVQAMRGHVAIETIIGLLPPRVNRVRLILVDVASLAFCAFFAWKSWTLLHEAWVDGYHSGSTWGPPLWIPYSLMTFGMALLSVQILLQVIDEVARRSRPR
jgi:TRAP-type C4-dicarboxylate transport system permease small subunit